MSLLFKEPFGFGDALHALQGGLAVARAGWNGKGMWLRLQVPDANSKMTLPYIYMKTADGQLVPWLASQTDLLSKDWGVVPDVQGCGSGSCGCPA